MAFARSGKVRGQTPRVEPEEKLKKKNGRAGKRKLFNKRIVEEENKEKETLAYQEYNPQKNDLQIIKKEDLELVEGRVEYEENTPIYILQEKAKIEFSRSLLMDILKRENEIRLSEEIQDLYTKMRYNWNGAEEYDGFLIDRMCQIQVLTEFGFNPHEDDSLQAYQLSCGKWMKDPQVKECVVWMKCDKMRFGSLKCGDLAPDASLYSLEGTPISLSSFIHQERPLILVGGSYT